MREGPNDELAWQQEYLQSLEEATGYLSYELLATCEDAAATKDLLLAEIDPTAGDLYLGVDNGRRRDLVVMWLLRLVGDVNWLRRVIEFASTSYAEQREVLHGLLPRMRRVCTNATGLGMQMAEEANQSFAQVEAVPLPASVKSDRATTLRRAFADRGVRVPVSSVVRTDLHSVRPS